MSEKNVNTRIIHKHDTEINWSKATNFKPKQGEIIIYDKDDNYNYERIKVGDGVTLVNDLPFYGSSIENILDGIASGSVRTSSSTTESTDYKLGTAAFAEGSATKASGNFSHAEGYNTTASGAYSHAEGRSSTASGSVSHAEGTDTVASGIRSHASGYGTIAKGQNQTAIGKYNIEDTSEEYALIVGNGTSAARSNAFTVDWSGNAKAGGKKLATEAYVDGKISDIPTPDVSGQIETHNKSTGAHSDIRQSISEKASASDLTTHTSNSTIHVTTAEKTKWDAKSNFSGSYADLTNKPAIPSKTSDLTNDSNFITSAGAPVQSVDGSTGAVVTNAVKYNAAQNLTNTQKAQARSNIGAGTSSFSGSYTDLTNKPTIPTKISQLTNDSGYLTSAPVTSVNGKTGAINLTASDVGALPAGTDIPSLDGLATQTYVDNKVAALVDSAPGALDTLNELAAALGDDPDFATTVANQIGNKVDKVDGKGLSTNDYTTAEKNKLAGIATGANNYTHPTTSGNKHIPSGGSSGQILRWSADGTAAWGADNNTDTKVTAVGNHYTPNGGTTTSASGGTLTDITNSSAGVQVVTGVTKDAAGHVTGITSVALKSVNTVYTHPSTHPATMITEDSTHRFVTDAEKNKWNEKEVFIATYDTTTFDEILGAYNSGKTIMAKYNGSIYQLVSADTSLSFMFVSVVKNSEYVTYIECELSGDWYFYNGKRLLPDAGTSNKGKYLGVNDSGVAAWTSLPTDTNKVDLSSAQTIGGAKTFSADLAASSNLTVGGNITATGTITGSKVYNAVWNDYAEWFEKDNEEEIFTPGEICIWTGNGVTKSTKANDKAAVGIVSDSYGHILGGEELEDMEDNNKKFVPIGLKGRVKCKVTGPVEIGDLIVTSDITGVGIVNNNANNGIIIGKALENSNDTGIKEIIVLI